LLATSLRLARAGYGGGDPEKIMAMRVDLVLAALEYEGFVSNYERTWVEINREL
jgi:hypothetical protein